VRTGRPGAGLCAQRHKTRHRLRAFRLQSNELVAPVAPGHGIRKRRQPPDVAAPGVALLARDVVPGKVPTARGGWFRGSARFPGRDALAQDKRLHRSGRQAFRHRQVVAGQHPTANPKYRQLRLPQEASGGVRPAHTRSLVRHLYGRHTLL